MSQSYSLIYTHINISSTLYLFMLGCTYHYHKGTKCNKCNTSMIITLYPLTLELTRYSFTYSPVHSFTYLLFVQSLVQFLNQVKKRTKLLKLLVGLGLTSFSLISANLIYLQCPQFRMGWIKHIPS